MSSGGRKPTVSDEKVLRLFQEHWAPFRNATELTDELDMSRQGALSRLKKLEEKGYLDSKKHGRTRNFWLTDEGEEFLDQHDPA